MTFSAEGAHVLVTGASRGIGYAVAAEFARRGALVTAVARNQQQLDALADATGSVPLVADLTAEDDVKDLVARAESLNGPLDVLVNNAGIMIVGPIAGEDPERMRSTLALNLGAPVELCRQALVGMIVRHRGRIVNVSSLGGVTPLREIATYGATKAGLSLFTSAMQREIASTSVRATIVELGEVAGTELMEGVRQSTTIDAMSKRLLKLHAFVSMTPEQVATKIVDATLAGHPYLVMPARSTVLHVIRELPGKITDAIFYNLPTASGHGTVLTQIQGER
jgi:short-subunit dehydrogenase